MIDCICPQCNKIMLHLMTSNHYYCGKCKIKYLSFLEGAFNNYQLLVNEDFFAEGTFEHCCRLFKLKVFS